MRIIALIILAFLFGIQLLASKARLNKIGFFGIASFLFSAMSIFLFAGYLSFQQYFFWKNNELGQFLLPPHQNFEYFIFYLRTRFFNPYLFSLAVGIVFLVVAKYFNKKYEERFFEPIEPYLLTTSIFLVGHPTWLVYLILLLIIFLIVNILVANYHLLITHKEMPRISLYYFWFPVAIFTILISRWLSVLPWFQMLRF